MIAALIAMKSVFLAFFVIPPADIPDESGHYAYVKDIASGNFFPLLGRSTIPNDLWMDAPPNKAESPVLPRNNYIVQHPPLYYAAAAIPYALARAATDDRWYHIRFTRLVSALSLGLAVLVLFRTFQDLGLQKNQSILLASSIAFIPTLSNLSAGITNDIFLLLLCALATLHLVRFVLHQRIADAYSTALWLTMAGATKMTAWIMIAGYVAIMLYELEVPWRRWLLHAVGISMVAFAAPAWWMLRNFVNFGTPFYIGIDTPPLALPDATVLQFLSSEPFFYFIWVHFYALFGFSGYCQTPELIHLCVGTQITHVNNEPFFGFLMITAAVALVVALYILKSFPKKQILRDPGQRDPSLHAFIENSLARTPGFFMPLLGISAVFAGALFFIAGFLHLYRQPGFFAGYMVSFLTLLPVLLAPLSLVVLASTSNARTRLVQYGLLVFLLFGILFIRQAHIAYVIIGEMRGVQGRYFFSYLPIMLVSAAIALQSIKFRSQHFLWVLILLVLAETYTYVQHVIPFFEAVRL
ncbi:glycosyltransferase family 39 protein [Hydrogenophaga sp.]|uniref:glycosyltransferase family 39 protein n=1 Tax=Hydrogenophaga sp. TaxID=1904254 RepID=UPI00272D21B8|nr:glycosyltransferase family 39 protein [Hydrogenophaga sp.]